MIRVVRSTLVLVLFLLVSPIVAPLTAQFDPVGEIVLPASAGGNFWWAVEKDGYVYAITGWGGFYVYDVRALGVDGPFTTFNTPVSQQDIGSLFSLFRVGNTLYIGGGALRVMDITDPAAPAPGVTLGDGEPRYMTKSGDYLLATGNDFLGVYSIIDPSNPTLLASTTLGGDSGFSVARSGQNIYVGAFRGSGGFLRVFSWTGGDTFTSVREIPTSDVYYQLIINGSYLAGTWGGKAQIWSLADPSLPVLVNEQTASGRAACLWGDKLITNGRVHKWHGPLLEEFSTFVPLQSQHDGVPHGAVGNAKFIFLAQQHRILILATPPTLVFPQYINGLYGATPNSTRLVLKNSGDEAATGLARFRTTAGMPNPVSIGGADQSEVSYAIPAGGTRQIITDGTGGLSNGPLEVRSETAADTDVSGTVIFSLFGHDVSAQAAPLAKNHRVFASRTSGEDTGVAVYNPSLVAIAELEARLFDKDGAQVAGPVTLTVGPRVQRAVFISEAPLFETYFVGLAGDFEGTLTLRAAGGPVAVMSFIQKSTGALLAVPVESETPPGP